MFYYNITICFVSVQLSLWEEFFPEMLEAVWYLEQIEDGQVYCFYPDDELHSDVEWQCTYEPNSIIKVDENGVQWWEYNWLVF